MSILQNNRHNYLHVQPIVAIISFSVKSSSHCFGEGGGEEGGRGLGEEGAGGRGAGEARRLTSTPRALVRFDISIHQSQLSKRGFAVHRLRAIARRELRYRRIDDSVPPFGNHCDPVCAGPV